MLTVGEAAKKLGRSVKTLQRWDRTGVLSSQRTSTNRRAYSQDQINAFLGKKDASRPRISLAYCRVSSNAQKPDLRNQHDIITQFCVAKGLANVEYIEEIGGGMNFTRPKFINLINSICRDEVDILILAHKDRLVRFGFDLIQHLCNEHGCQVLVINDERHSPEREMVEDLMTIINCFSNRLYGLRNYKKALAEHLKQ